MTESKHLVAEAFTALADGDGGPLVASLAPDARWTIMGTTPWSGSYEGRDAILATLLRPLMRQFDGRYASVPRRVIAEDDLVVVESQGRALTATGLRYDNRYCFVCRVAGGRVREVTEYLDTELVTKALAPPPGR